MLQSVGAGAGISICGLDAPAGASTPLGRINHRTQIMQKTRPARKPIKRTGLKPGFGVADCADTPGICGMSVLKRWDGARAGSPFVNSCWITPRSNTSRREARTATSGTLL